MKKVLLLAAIICSVVTAVSFAKDEKMAMPAKFQSLNLKDIVQFDSKGILNKKPMDTDKFVFNVYFLEPRQLLPFHKHPTSDELFYIVEGRGQFTVGNDQVMVDSGSVVYGPEDTNHGIVNSGKQQMVVVTVQAPKPVKTVFAQNMTLICPSCGQEDILPDNAKEGDIFVCPRCGARLRLSKTKDGKWIGTPAD